MQRSIQISRRATPKSAPALLRQLPGISRLLNSRPVAPLLREYGSHLVTELLRESLEELRRQIRAGELEGDGARRALGIKQIAATVRRRASELLEARPRSVLNASGIVVHTNLGRSVLSEPAAGAVARAARGYLDLEFDLETGRRGSRLGHLEPLLERLFPGSTGLAVNNNAAAILLCLRALSRRREVLVSRGELVEIGGSFRVPDIMAASGARLREVGTTNRTRLSDYRQALSERTGLILKVHTSNFKIVGFTQETSIAELSGLAQDAGLPLVVDWGSGDLVDLSGLGIDDELPVNDVLAAGADLVTFSGDKLLGGPQAGIVVGKADWIARLRKDPLARVCRLDRLLIAALHSTLSAYVRGRQFDEIPTLRMLALDADEIGRRAERLRRAVSRRTGKRARLSIVEGISRTGGGSSPTGQRPTRLLAIGWSDGDAVGLERRLRGGTPPVIGRMQEGRLLLDLRTVPPGEDELLAELLASAIEAEAATR